MWFGLLRLQEAADLEQQKNKIAVGAFPKLRRVEKCVEEALRSISRELVWKLHFEKAQIEERAAEWAAENLADQCTDLDGAAYDSTLFSKRHRYLRHARRSYARSLLSSPSNLSWKVLLAMARLELSANRIDKSRMLLLRAIKVVPAKSRGVVFLECARVEECVDNVDGALTILAHAIEQVPMEWKLFLEAAMIFSREMNIREAFEKTREALHVHPGTGRLWAFYVQLCHRHEVGCHRLVREAAAAAAAADMGHSETSAFGQYTLRGRAPSDMDEVLIENSSPTRVTTSALPCPKAAFVHAINEVPKSGEVWCEGARVALNPMLVTRHDCSCCLRSKGALQVDHDDVLTPRDELLYGCFDLSTAQRCLSFAVIFTPQSDRQTPRILKLCRLLRHRISRLICIVRELMHLSHYIHSDRLKVGCLRACHVVNQLVECCV